MAGFGKGGQGNGSPPSPSAPHRPADRGTHTGAPGLTASVQPAPGRNAVRLSILARMAPVLDVVVPVHNEEADREPCLRRLHAQRNEHLPYPFRITMADPVPGIAHPKLADTSAFFT